jgi:dihydroorotase
MTLLLRGREQGTPMTDRITISKPDDWHLHFRDPGPAHDRPPPDVGIITLERKPYVAAKGVKVERLQECPAIYRGGETLGWQVTDVF